MVFIVLLSNMNFVCCVCDCGTTGLLGNTL